MNAKTLASLLALSSTVLCSPLAVAADDCKLTPGAKGELRCMKLAAATPTEAESCPNGPYMKQVCARPQPVAAELRADGKRVAATPSAAGER